MDLVLDLADGLAFDKLYSFAPKSLEFLHDPQDWKRQSLTVYLAVYISAFIFYFLFAGTNYYLFFDHDLKKHPRWLPQQISKEIALSTSSFSLMTLYTMPWFMGEVWGWSQLYSGIEDINQIKLASTFPLNVIQRFAPFQWLKQDQRTYGDLFNGIMGEQFGQQYGAYVFLVLSALTFLLFTDMLIYFIHRGLHHPLVYSRIHKPHHRWIVPSPFASHAFHPLDGYLQSIPYHIYAFCFPMQKVLHLGMFIFVNFWTVSIHDNVYVVGDGEELAGKESTPIRLFRKVFHFLGLNGAAHHSMHHLYFKVNYGQYFVFWDWLCGSFRVPTSEILDHFKLSESDQEAKKAGTTSNEEVVDEESSVLMDGEYLNTKRTRSNTRNRSLKKEE
ncbi:hypothetical protein MIR68_007784 [Amoeboaphelidium protococcarum]|nr:hypothetical protein MIR68_007784 [Amoeboaphelidium protococcarum]